MCDCDCKACKRCESRESKAHERSEVGKSAFGVYHEDVSKGLIGGIKTGMSGLRLGNARSAVRVVGSSYRRSVKSGATKTDAAIKGIGLGIKRSPGTAMGVGAAGVGAVGGTGYAAGKIKD